MATVIVVDNSSGNLNNCYKVSKPRENLLKKGKFNYGGKILYTDSRTMVEIN